MITYFKYAFLFVAFIYVNEASAQDLMLTRAGDSINCKITDGDLRYVYFTHQYNNKVNSTLIERTHIAKYEKDFYSYPEVPIQYVVGFKNYDQFNVGVTIGYSNRTANLADELTPEMKALFEQFLTGFSVGLDVNYYYSKNYGFGFRVNRHNAYGVLENLSFSDENGQVWYGDLVGIIAITYLAPSFNIRSVDKRNRYAFNCAFSMGYMGYYQEFDYAIGSTEGVSSTLGMAVDLGFDVKIVGGLVLGTQISVYSGVISELTYTKGTETETVEFEDGTYEGLGRIDLSLGLRYAF